MGSLEDCIEMKGLRSKPSTLRQKFSQAQKCTATHTCSTDSLKLAITIYLSNETNRNRRKFIN